MKVRRLQRVICQKSKGEVRDSPLHLRVGLFKYFV